MLFRRTSLEVEQMIFRQEGHSSHLTLGKLAAKATVGGRLTTAAVRPGC